MSPSSPRSSGSLHTHHVAAGAGRSARRFRVWTPAGYTTDPTHRYPVLYVQDGQNVFDGDSAFAGVGWELGTTAQRLIDKQQLPPLLLVGIDNSGAHRTDEYTPVPWHGRGGHAADLAHLLIEAIKPFVDRHYRTRPDAEHTAIAGSSLGGLFALHTGLRRLDVFGHVAALSPSVFWGDDHLLRLLAPLPHRLPVRIWLDAGKRETANVRDGARRLAELLLGKGWQKHRTARRATLRHVEVAGGRHDERSWGRRFDRVLKFLFPMPAAPAKRRRRQPPPPATG